MSGRKIFSSHTSRVGTLDSKIVLSICISLLWSTFCMVQLQKSRADCTYNTNIKMIEVHSLMIDKGNYICLKAEGCYCNKVILWKLLSPLVKCFILSSKLSISSSAWPKKKWALTRVGSISRAVRQSWHTSSHLFSFRLHRARLV